MACTDIQVHYPKIRGNLVERKFAQHRILNKNPAFHAVLVILSILCMNFTETHLQECAWRAAINSFWRFQLLVCNYKVDICASSVKLSYSCTENMKSIITTHNKKLPSKNFNTVPPCNCKIKNKCLLKGKYSTRNVLNKCVASISMKPDKVIWEQLKEIFSNVNSTYLMTQQSPNMFGISKNNTAKPHFWNGTLEG